MELMRKDGRSGTMDVVVNIVDMLSTIGSIDDNPSCNEEEGEEGVAEEADGTKEFDDGKYRIMGALVAFLLRKDVVVDGVINVKLLDGVKQEKNIIIAIIII
jgi:hypothetical protein